MAIVRIDADIIALQCGSRGKYYIGMARGSRPEWLVDYNGFGPGPGPAQAVQILVVKETGARPPQ